MGVLYRLDLSLPALATISQPVWSVFKTPPKCACRDKRQRESFVPYSYAFISYITGRGGVREYIFS